jgi:methylated-DNA-[protein]-cysteine S-methyltransferase
MELQIGRVPSPIGLVLLVCDGTSLVSLDFEGYESRLHALLAKRYDGYRLVETRDPLGAARRVEAWFAGDLAALDAIPVETGGTEFQRAVWQGLRRIPAGTVMSYGALAASLGRPKASRAVGYANSLNPVAIVLPCHRVIGSNLKLTGYAGGLDRKRWLLEHERAFVAEVPD